MEDSTSRMLRCLWRNDQKMHAHFAMCLLYIRLIAIEALPNILLGKLNAQTHTVKCPCMGLQEIIFVENFMNAHTQYMDS